IREAGLMIEAEEAIEELDRVRVVQIETEKVRVYARTEISGKVNQILRALGVKIPPTVLKEKDIVQ
ncbi:MAG: hypothetical protein N2511_03685, partial [Thermodesulfovibrionales bacterium]|nr:hypothetical protein [Thermodesulfovibrionales bacterium]